MSSINPRAATGLPTSQQTLAAQSLPMTGLGASPYDGTSPTMGMPIMGSTGQVPQLSGLPGGSPQLNATNQTAIAHAGDVNQVVTNENTNKYYNIIVPHGGGLLGGIGGAGGLFGGWNTPGNSFVDPKTGVLYVQQETGITGWFKRLFRGY